MFTYIFELSFASVSKQICVRIHSNEIDFCLHVHFHANQNRFHTKGFAQTRFETEADGNSGMAY